MQSRIPGFYNLTPDERVNRLIKKELLSTEEATHLQSGLSMDESATMVENVVGYMPVPMGIATNFKVNQRDIFIPMATEEPSVIAAASHAAKLTYDLGGFTTSETQPLMIGQIQLLHVKRPYETMAKIYENKAEVLSLCNDQDETLINLGGGAKDLEVRVFPEDQMVIVHLIVDTRDAMGANTINSMAEAVSPRLEQLTDGKVGLRIISNLADQRVVRARAKFKNTLKNSEQEKFLQAYQFAMIDPYRATTHNKGIMNGISAVALATGNDTRAIEAGAHAYASRTGTYRSLTHWEVNEAGTIVGTIELPLAVGIVGGATQANKVAHTALKLMQIERVQQLKAILAAVGLAQNFAALRALVSEGIQSGHMKLHVANLAKMAGATETEIIQVVERAESLDRVTYDQIKYIINDLRSS